MAGKDSTFRLSTKAKRTSPPPINYMIATALEREDLISLAVGLVDEETLPVREVLELAGEVLSDPTAGRAALQYGSTAGLAGLREALLEYVCAQDGVRPQDLSVTADNIVVASGSQQLLYIVTDVLVDPGDIVITGWPSYFVYTAVLVSMGASVRGVELDEDGMVPEALERTLHQIRREGLLHRVKIVYLCDYHQNPTGITLSRQRRRRILEIVQAYSREHRICLLEDAAYRELGAEDAEDLPSIKGMEADNAQVLLAQTFSKTFAPGLRTGYAVLPDELVAPVLNQKGNHDFGSTNLAQHILLRAMRSGAYAEHISKVRRRYGAKLAAMLTALNEHFGPLVSQGAKWTRPSGGLYVYVTLPQWIDTGRGGELFEAALSEGVLYVPGQYCYGPDKRRRVPSNELRLTYGTVDEAAIVEGVARLARAVDKVCREHGKLFGAKPLPSEAS